MKEVSILKLNEKNKFIKELEYGWFRAFGGPCIDVFFIVILLMFMHVIGDTVSGIGWDSFCGMHVITWVLTYILIQFIIGMIEIIFYLRLSGSVIVKSDDKILILYGLNSINADSANKIEIASLMMRQNGIKGKFLGIPLMLSGIGKAKVVSQRKTKYTIEDMDKVIENAIKFNDKVYIDCKFIKERKTHYLFNGNRLKRNGKVKNKNFKIYKIYYNMKCLLKEEN